MKNYSHNSKTKELLIRIMVPRNVFIANKKGKGGNMKKHEPKLEAAAKKVMRSINHHFKTDGWDLDYSFQVAEVFYEAFGYNLEEHLLPKLLKTYELRSIDGRFIIAPRKGKRQ